MHVQRILIFRNSCGLRQIGTTGNVSFVAQTRRQSEFARYPDTPPAVIVENSCDGSSATLTCINVGARH